MNGRRAWTAVVLALAAAGMASAQVVLHGMDRPANRVNLLLAGDGWLSSQLSDPFSDQNAIAGYRPTCEELIDGETGLFKKPPFDLLSNFFTVRMVNVTSQRNQAAGDEDEEGAPADAAGRMAFGTAVVHAPPPADEKLQRIWFRDPASAYAKLVELNREIPRHAVVVILNQQSYAGGAKAGDGGAPAIVTCTKDPNAATMLAHQLGHALFGLADEYFDPAAPGPVPGEEPEELNVSLEASPAKWKPWLELRAIRPEQGARYCAKGVYRPQTHCIMGADPDHDKRKFCAVCQHRIIERVYEMVSLIDAVEPAAKAQVADAGVAHAFKVQTVAPVGARLAGEWFLDGVHQKSEAPVAANPGPSFASALEAAKLPAGQHTVRLLVSDPTRPAGPRAQLPPRPLNQWDWHVKVLDRARCPGLTVSSRLVFD